MCPACGSDMCNRCECVRDQMQQTIDALVSACKIALNDRMYKDWPAVADALIAAVNKAEGRP